MSTAPGDGPVSPPSPAARPDADTATTIPVVALVGNPNVGKSTLFNRLTGARQLVVNAPGTTVEVTSGTWNAPAPVGAPGVRLLDLPGSYSLVARSPDEEATAAALADVDLAVVVVDASAMARSLYLVGQVGTTRTPMVVVVTMQDVADARGTTVDVDTLRDALGVPVVPVDPRRGEGLAQLADSVRSALDLTPQLRLPHDEQPGPPAPLTGLDERLDAAEQLFGWVADIQDRTTRTTLTVRLTRSDKVDRWMLRPWVGIPAFLVVLWAVFQLSTAAAGPLMDGASWLVTDALGGALHTGLDQVGAPVWLTGLLLDGVLAGVSTVASFLPLMAVMFLAVGMLEDSGYLARAAFVADRAMRPLGLDGRAVLPLVVGFGCNVSAMAALRTLPNARQRVLAALLVPFTSCTARLAVYVMLGAVFFPQAAGAAVLGMYVLSGLLVVGIGLLLRRTAFADLRREPLIIAMPSYQRPRVRSLLASTGVRSWAFVTGAGTVIVVTLTVVWLAMAVPVHGTHPVGQVPVEDSAYGAAAHAVAPVFSPAGFGDWGAASALATGVVAKEVVVGSLQQAYAVDGQPWTQGLREAFDRTSGGHGAAAAFAFLVFTLVYTPCLATVAELRRQVGTRWTAVSVVGSTTLAWALATLVFQVGRLL